MRGLTVIERKEWAVTDDTIFLTHHDDAAEENSMHKAPIPALPDDVPAESDDPGPLPGGPSEDEPVPDHNPS